MDHANYLFSIKANTILTSYAHFIVYLNNPGLLDPCYVTMVILRCLLDLKNV